MVIVVIHSIITNEKIMEDMHYMYQVAKYIERIGKNLRVGVSQGATSVDLAL